MKNIDEIVKQFMIEWDKNNPIPPQTFISIYGEVRCNDIARQDWSNRRFHAEAMEWRRLDLLRYRKEVVSQILVDTHIDINECYF